MILHFVNSEISDISVKDLCFLCIQSFGDRVVGHDEAKCISFNEAR